MPMVLTVSGAVCVLVGCIWVLQGIGVLPGSFMTGQMKWAVYGGILLVAGIGMVITARRRRTLS